MNNIKINYFNTVLPHLDLDTDPSHRMDSDNNNYTILKDKLLDNSILIHNDKFCGGTSNHGTIGQFKPTYFTGSTLI